MGGHEHYLPAGLWACCMPPSRLPQVLCHGCSLIVFACFCRVSCVRAHPGRTGEGYLAASPRAVCPACPAPSARYVQFSSSSYECGGRHRPR
eukprot:7042433-Prymnesium_polylepis.1